MRSTPCTAALTLAVSALFAGCQPRPTLIPVRPPIDRGASSSADNRHDPASSSSRLRKAMSAATLPSSAKLSVPFSPQAPFANWDAAHEEACEEMSLIMVVHALHHSELTAENAERELQTLLTWEATHGYSVDVTIEQLSAITRDEYGIRSSTVSGVSEESIERAIAAGHPVILPIAGRELGNPYFSGEGPWYHMLVVTGYRHGFFGQTIFITNDPGTKRGENYEYGASTLINAVHDWTGVKEEIDRGERRMMIIE